MLKLKFYFFILATLLFTDVNARAAGEFLRNADGRIKYMNHHEALRACPAGTHLPTVREIGQVAQSHGAKGLLDASDPDLVPGGYGEISAVNPDGKHDKFYFNSEGFQRPADDFGNEWIWSSSISTYSTDPNTYAYFIRGDLGLIDYVYREGNNVQLAVFCVRDRLNSNQ